MRVRPDGVELLQAARLVLDTTIVPQLAEDRRTALHAIEEAITLAQDRLAHDAQASAADLATLEDARAALRGEVFEALPEQHRYDARLVAKAMAVATRQLANGHATDRREYERLAALLGAPTVTDASSHEIRCTLYSLNERLGTSIRAGEADVGTTTYAATLAHLEAITHEALSESNPTYSRRATGSAQSNSQDEAHPAEPVAPIAAACAAWGDVPRAFVRAFPMEVPSAPISERIDAWVHLNGAVGEALCASSNVALSTQADIFGWFAHRLAANPRVPMAAVEGAHQAHDVFVAFAEASAEFCKLALAPFRRVESPHARVTRLP